MKYVKVAQKNELTEGTKKKVSIEGIEILIANIGNEYFAVDNKCPHMGGSLYDGKHEGSMIICPRHGSIFDLKTGEVVKGGKLLFMNVKVKNLKKYAVKVEGDEIFVGLE